MSGIPPCVNEALAAMRFRDAKPEALHALSHAQWTDLLSYLDYMHLTLVFGQKCAAYLPPWVQSRIATNLSDNREHLRRLRAAYAEIRQAMLQAGLDHIVLKGFSSWLEPGAHVENRMQSDIDLYCPPQLVVRAREALNTVGFVSSSGEYLPTDEHLPKMFRPSNWQWRGNHFDPDMPISVELHDRFWNPTSAWFGPHGLAQFWDRRVSIHQGDLQLETLDCADALAYSSLHVLRHAFDRALLTYHVYEVGSFLHRSAANYDFWDKWFDLHHPSLRQLEAIAFRFAQEWFSCDLSSRAQQEIAALPAAVQRWFDRYSRSPIYAMFQPNKHTLWLHLALIEEPKDRRSALLHGLFPIRGPKLEIFAGTEERERISAGFIWKTCSAFLRYTARRLKYHATALPSALWHGIHWWWNEARASRDA